MMPPNQDDTGKFKQGDDLSALLADLLNTPEARRLLTGVGSQWLHKWSDGNRLKQRVERPAARAWAKILSTNIENDLADVFEKPEHLEALARAMPQVIDSLGSVLLAMARGVEKMPADRKATMFRQLCSPLADGGCNPWLFSVAHTAEELYHNDPHFFSSLLMPLLERWIAGTDFGELKGLFDTAKSDLGALLNQAAGILFEYPAKMVTLLAFLPDLSNLVLSFLEKLLKSVNAMPPDILTDLLLSLFRQVDGDALGNIITRAGETIRQLHTGSTLIGEMDAPRFTTDLTDKIGAVMAAIDPALAVKARKALIDGRETLLGVLMDATAEHPEILNLWLHQLAVKRNSNIRLFKRKIDLFETLPEEEAIEALSAGLSGWNAYDLAETVNALARTVNRIRQVKPDLFKRLVTEFVDALDLYELEESLEGLSHDLAETIRPVFRVAVPPIIRELCGFFTPADEDDGYDDAMEEARTRLRHFILGKEPS